MSLQFDRSAVKKAFKGGHGMIKLILQFNLHPAAYAHCSWFEGFMPPDLFNVLRRTKRGTSRLSDLLLEHYGLCDDACFDFACRRWRFALLPANVIGELALYCGLAFKHRQIAALVDKATIAGIKAGIGEKAYTFAVKRAPLVIGQRTGMDARRDGRGNFGGFALHEGAAYFLSHFRESPRAIAGRLAFKFPRSVAEMVVNRESDDKGWPLFKRLLLHEIDSRWQTLFS